MVAPNDFEFNKETSYDNAFQSCPDEERTVINARAMVEFNSMVETLRALGISVILLEPRETGPKTPDALFPNNWFSTEHDGTLLLYPMMPVGRRLEKRLDALERALPAQRYAVNNVINIGRYHETEHFLEGTGCLVIDHEARIVYAARSERCHPEQLQNFAALRQYESVLFSTEDSRGRPIYHTNVMMSIGERFAVVCPDVIASDAERDNVLQRLKSRREVIELSREQVEQHMCGNILQLRNNLDQALIVMSQRAYNGFTAAQRLRLDTHGRLVPVHLDTIESVGGGSARCMLAEIFLPTVASAL